MGVRRIDRGQSSGSADRPIDHIWQRPDIPSARPGLSRDPTPRRYSLRGGAHSVSRMQSNGLSQTNAVGDDFQATTTCPLIRISNKDTRHVIYVRTHDHSSWGVATGSSNVSTHCAVPDPAESGPSTLVV